MEYCTTTTPVNRTLHLNPVITGQIIQRASIHINQPEAARFTMAYDAPQPGSLKRKRRRRQDKPAVSAKLSHRARTLSTRRRNNIKARSEGLDLSGQDAPLHDRDSWVPAGEHKGDEYDDEEEEEDDVPSHSMLDNEHGNGETRGRTHEALAA